jgi:carbon monoxide dehydrogenase subunit G
LELQHSFTVPADVDTAWATLLDLEGVAPCFPGATLTGVDGDEFAGQVKVKLGPVSLQYAGKGRFVERDDAAHRAVIEAHGSDKRGNGTAGATVVAHLEAETEDSTRVVVSTELKVTGRPAQFGRGVMQDVGSRIVDQFAANLARHIAGEDTAVVVEPAPAPVPAVQAAAAPVAAASASPVPAASAPSVPAASAPSVPAPAELPPLLANATAPTAPARPPAPRPPSLPRSTPAPAQELDLNSVVLPVLARQYGPTVIAVLVTAIVTWFIARRRR